MNIPQEYFLDGADDFWTISLFWPVKIGVNMFNWVKWSKNQISSLREKFEKFFIVKTKLGVESFMMKHFRIISYKCHRYQMLREKNSKKYIHRHWLRYRLKKGLEKYFDGLSTDFWNSCGYSNPCSNAFCMHWTDIQFLFHLDSIVYFNGLVTVCVFSSPEKNVCLCCEIASKANGAIKWSLRGKNE